MELLKERILKDGKVRNENVLKVDSFLNHQIDVELLEQIAKEFHRIFKDENITKILTIEASGIAIGSFVAKEYKVPLVFAKKSQSINLDGEMLWSEVPSFTHGTINKAVVAKKFLDEKDVVLVVDDFLARGNALLGLTDIVRQSGARLAGCGIVIEKAFDKGGDLLRSKGIRVESLAIIKSMSKSKIEFI